MGGTQIYVRAYFYDHFSRIPENVVFDTCIIFFLSSVFSFPVWYHLKLYRYQGETTTFSFLLEYSFDLLLMEQQER